MMKNNYKIFTALAFTSLLFLACDDGDAIPDEILTTTTNGAVLRTINVVSNELPIGSSDGFFGVDLEIQSRDNGSLVDAVEVFATFLDNTPDNGVGATSDEVMVETISSSEFTIGRASLPQLSYTISLPELLSATGLTEPEIDGGDQFQVRFELVLSDGRRFSVADNTNTLTGAFFSSPFIYNSTVVCPPFPPEAGEWTIDMTDAFGDGWNGASLTITVDGIEMMFDVSGDEATASTETLTVPTGTQVISVIFNSGAFDGEVGYTITASNGTIVAEKEAYGDAVPVATELLNYCIMNF